MGAALVAVGVGSAGAAVLAMSLLASDLPNPMPEQEIIASATQPVAVEAPVVEEPIFKDLIPATPGVTQAQAGTVSPPAVVSAAGQSQEDLAALAAGNPRFAHDASAARGLEDVDDLQGAEVAFGPTRKVMKIPFDQVDVAQPEEKETAPVKAEPAPKAAGSGKLPSGTALMVEDANIRSRPQKGSKVIGTVPARTQVQLVGCQSWCEIVVKGKRGFVWGEFVQRSGRVSTKFTVSKASANAADPAKPDIVPAGQTVPHPDSNRVR